MLEMQLRGAAAATVSSSANPSSSAPSFSVGACKFTGTLGESV